LRFAAQAERAGAICYVHVWKAMVHVFPSNLSALTAAGLDDLRSHLRGALEGLSA